MLTSPTLGTLLLLYIAAAEGAVSAVLVEEVSYNRREEQAPVYYVSEALAGGKLRYTELEKMACAVIMASRKLKHYFTAHPITIPTSYPLREVF